RLMGGDRHDLAATPSLRIAREAVLGELADLDARERRRAVARIEQRDERGMGQAEALGLTAARRMRRDALDLRLAEGVERGGNEFCLRGVGDMPIGAAGMAVLAGMEKPVA